MNIVFAKKQYFTDPISLGGSMLVADWYEHEDKQNEDKPLKSLFAYGVRHPIPPSILTLFTKNLYEMEYIKKVSVSAEDFFATQFEAHSIVLTNEDCTNVWQILLKCRRATPQNVCKQILRALLESVLNQYNKRHEDCVMQSKNYGLGNEFKTKCLSTTRAYTTDKNGYILPNSAVTVEGLDGEYVPLKKVIRLTKSMPVYQLFVEEGKPWGHPELSKEVDAWLEAFKMNVTYMRKFDEKLGEIVEDNATEVVIEEANLLAAPHPEEPQIVDAVVIEIPAA